MTLSEKVFGNSLKVGTARVVIKLAALITMLVAVILNIANTGYSMAHIILPAVVVLLEFICCILDGIVKRKMDIVIDIIIIIMWSFSLVTGIMSI